ncbi:MAG: Zn-dependent protease/predicted transcriptional regulator [Halobacteriales archaeon]|jgi:Zn-dependent protease/predicted transcriptional regulator
MRSYTIARIWDIPIRINVSLVVFLPVLAWLIGSGGQIELYAGVLEGLTDVAFDLDVLTAGNTPWAIGIAAAVGLFVSVTLHELGHSWVAIRYGLSIDSITLWILGGMAALSEMPREWDREFWIAIAGPVTSVAVGAVCYVSVLALGPSLPVVRFVLGWLALTNGILAAFNLLPAFPMDGGRILRALLARNRSYASATRVAGRIGVIFAILFAVIGVLGFNVILLLLALFIYGAATTESRTVLLDELLEGVVVGDVMTRDPPTVSSGTTVAELVDRMMRDRKTAYPVVDDATGDVVGVVTLEDLRGVREVERDAILVGEIAREVPRVDPGADAFETLSTLTGTTGNLMLVGDERNVVGLLTQGDYAHALSMQREFQSGVR